MTENMEIQIIRELGAGIIDTVFDIMSKNEPFLCNLTMEQQFECISVAMHGAKIAIIENVKKGTKQ